MDPLKIIEKYYSTESRAYYLLIHHSKMVTEKALKIARKLKHLNPDLNFIEEAAMLHDIGILFTNEPKIGCYGDKPYVCHGYLGRELLEKEGFPKHALICERHIGVGISRKDIEEKNLPLPKRDMVPVSIEEQIICYADKFFSKDSESFLKEKSIKRIREYISKFGKDKIKRFDEWVKIFGV
ncbi:MAG: HD domain-containing protein [Nitrospirota bacterium]